MCGKVAIQPQLLSFTRVNVAIDRLVAEAGSSIRLDTQPASYLLNGTDLAIGTGHDSCSATFEHQSNHRIRQRENPFQGPAAPEVLFYDGRLNAHPGGSYLKRFRSKLSRLSCESIHRLSRRRDSLGDGAHPFRHCKAVRDEFCAVGLVEGISQLTNNFVVDAVTTDIA